MLGGIIQRARTKCKWCILSVIIYNKKKFRLKFSNFLKTRMKSNIIITQLSPIGGRITRPSV